MATQDRLAALLAHSPVFDGHNDLPWALRKDGYDLTVRDIAQPQPDLHTDIPRLRAGASARSSGRCSCPAPCVEVTQ